MSTTETLPQKHDKFYCINDTGQVEVCFFVANFSSEHSAVKLWSVRINSIKGEMSLRHVNSLFPTPRLALDNYYEVLNRQMQEAQDTLIEVTKRIQRLRTERRRVREVVRFAGQ